MDTTIELTPAMLAIVPVVAFILQIIKGLPYGQYLNPYLPLVSMAAGIACAYGAQIPNPIVAGILIGIAASTGYKQFALTQKTNGATK